MRRFCFFAAVMLCATLAWPRAGSAERSGSVRGHVVVRRRAPANERRPTVSNLGAPAHLTEDRGRSVVYIDGAPRDAFEQTKPGHAIMDQRNEAFVPHVLAITTGTTVDFRNTDNIFHNVFSLSRVKSFDLGRYAAGRSKPVRFDAPGIVRVFCEIHSHMNAFILVFSHPFFAVTDDEGNYRIDDVPPGTYKVIAWNEGTASEPRPVAVADGGVAELDFSLR